MITLELIIIFFAILVVCLIGFKKYVWFISLGYGFSISIVGIMNLILFRKNINISFIISSLILILYGLRLSGFLAIREFKSSSYNQKMKTEIKDGKNMPFFVKVMMWITCGLLYLLMTIPVIYRFINNIQLDTYFIVGMSVALFGIIFESVADKEKSDFKVKNPSMFCKDGLYKIVRCPNYLGELIMWLGIFISGISALKGIVEWILAIIGFLGIIYVTFSGARRLELRQDRNYGEMKEYKEYVKKTPIIIPFIPLYSVKKHKWLIG